MEGLIFYAVISILFGFWFVYVMSKNFVMKTDRPKKQYKYFVKRKIMTDREAIFYEKLVKVCGDSIVVFPQIHLSSLFSHYVKGQSFASAFKKINGKSVDFVLCRKADLKPILAIELDDKSHSKSDRVVRDKFVEELFINASFPLLRFQSVNIQQDALKRDILDKLKASQ